MFSSSVTRRSFLRRATALAGGAATYVAVGRLPQARAAGQTGGNCSVFESEWSCRTGWGPPSCAQSCKTVYSPDDFFWGSFCCTCPGFCDCTPQYVQVRVTVCDSGGCSASCVAA